MSKGICPVEEVPDRETKFSHIIGRDPFICYPSRHDQLLASHVTITPSKVSILRFNFLTSLEQPAFHSLIRSLNGGDLYSAPLRLLLISATDPTPAEKEGPKFAINTSE